MSFINVLVLGHSFVSRLWKDIRNHRDPALIPNLNLYESGVRVRFCGIGGATIDTFLNDVHGKVHKELVNIPPKIVLVQIGGNDLDTEGFEKEVYAAKVREFVCRLHTRYNVELVVVCEIFGRLRLRTLDIDRYHRIRDEVNLNFFIEFSREEGVKFWRHKGGLMTNEDLFLPDKVHLNLKGTVKFYRSLRGAVISLI